MGSAPFRAQRQAEERLQDRLERLAGESERNAAHNVWIERLAPDASLSFQSGPPDAPLAGLVFAIKDNIDLSGVATTAGCPAYAYKPESSATVVERSRSTLRTSSAPSHHDGTSNTIATMPSSQ